MLKTLSPAAILRAVITDDFSISAIKNANMCQLSAIWRGILRKNPKIALDNTLRDIVFDSLVSILKK